MFKHVSEPAAKQVTIYFESIPLKVNDGITVAAAVLLAESGGKPQFNRVSPRKHEHRGAYCNMGICFECLMEIDGQPNQQSCMTTVREGMKVRRQQSAPDFSGQNASAAGS